MKDIKVPDVPKEYLWTGYDLIREYARQNIIHFYLGQAKNDMVKALHEDVDLEDVMSIFLYYQNTYGIIELKYQVELDDETKIFTFEELQSFCNSLNISFDDIADKTYYVFCLDEGFMKVEQKEHAKKMKAKKEREENIRKSKSRPKIITLCGSTRFKEEFEKVQRELTLQGIIVLSVGLFSHAEENGEEWATDGTKQMLDDLHKRKIDMSDEIYVINKNGYIGSSTKSEIEYAKNKGMVINYLEEPKKTL